MRRYSRLALAGFVALPGFVLGGCANDGLAPTLASLPELTGSVSEAPIVGSPTEVYERIARGVLACWFGSAGPLKANYVYHAEAEPPSKGGSAEITIHERDRLSANPKGVRAYRIAIASEKAVTTLSFENLKMPEAMARGMESDTRRWGEGAFGCADAQAGGWSEGADAPTPPASQAKGKAKRPPKGD
ncbi:MAG: hypothetical protein WC829_19195 [Hyphomicrobium sp.]|jgi:hypothetical protein